MDIGTFLPTIIGAVAGGIGSYAAIRERLAVIEAKHAADVARLDEKTGVMLAALERAHVRIDTLHGTERRNRA
jgi:hypothetical protein